jgi:hypothetical protein
MCALQAGTSGTPVYMAEMTGVLAVAIWLEL